MTSTHVFAVLSLMVNSVAALVHCFSLFLASDFDSTPSVTVISQLLKSIQGIHGLRDSQSRQLILLFFRFLGYPDENILRYVLGQQQLLFLLLTD